MAAKLAIQRMMKWLRVKWWSRVLSIDCCLETTYEAVTGQSVPSNHRIQPLGNPPTFYESGEAAQVADEQLYGPAAATHVILPAPNLIDDNGIITAVFPGNRYIVCVVRER